MRKLILLSLSIILSALGLMAVSQQSVSANTVEPIPATYKDFYLQSRITYFDRNASDNTNCLPMLPYGLPTDTSGGGGSATPTSPVSNESVVPASNNVETSYNFFIARGLKNYQSAGIVGNLMAESSTSINPKAQNSIGAYGIAQWLGDRKARLLKKANYDTLEVQLNFIWEELNSTHSRALSSLRASKNVAEATRVILERYEIPCMPGKACDSFQATRLKYAQSVLDQYGGNTAPAPGEESPEPGAGSSGPSEASGGGSSSETDYLSADICPVPQPGVEGDGLGGGGGGGESGTTPSAPTTGNKPGKFDDPNQACPAGTTDLGTVKTTYNFVNASTPYPTIRLCRLSSIGGSPRVNAAVADQFQRLGQAAKADGINLYSISSFRAGDSCGGKGGAKCASPGQSNHQLGIAIDFRLNDAAWVPKEFRGCGAKRAVSSDKEWRWLRDNAAKFGIRQLDYESWHWDADPGGNRC